MRHKKPVVPGLDLNGQGADKHDEGNQEKVAVGRLVQLFPKILGYLRVLRSISMMFLHGFHHVIFSC